MSDTSSAIGKLRWMRRYYDEEIGNEYGPDMTDNAREGLCAHLDKVLAQLESERRVGRSMSANRVLGLGLLAERVRVIEEVVSEPLPHSGCMYEHRCRELNNMRERADALRIPLRDALRQFHELAMSHLDDEIRKNNADRADDS